MPEPVKPECCCCSSPDGGQQLAQIDALGKSSPPWITGALTSAVGDVPVATTTLLPRTAWCLIIPATASFAAMNFTGATTYTSLSGVRREMRFAVPVQALATMLGTVLWIAGRFI